MPEYTCAMCRRTFENGWSEEESEKEAKEIFGADVMENDPAAVCDDCWQIIKPNNNPDVFLGWMAEHLARLVTDDIRLKINPSSPNT